MALEDCRFRCIFPPPMPELEPGLLNLAAIVSWIVLLISIIPIVLLLGSKRADHTEK